MLGASWARLDMRLTASADAAIEDNSSCKRHCAHCWKCATQKTLPAAGNAASCLELRVARNEICLRVELHQDGGVPGVRHPDQSLCGEP